MRLDDEQRARIRAAAEREGLDPDEVVAAAEGADEPNENAKGRGEANAATAEPPKLFQYHLPFVTVREVRQKWLGLTEPFAGDDEVAAEWSAKISGSGPAPSAPTDEAV